MIKSEYLEFHRGMCNKMVMITKMKNEDYTGKTNDPFANFSNVSACGGGSAEQGFLFRMNDKMMRVSSFVERGELFVKDESVEDTLLDLANYAVLFAGFIRSERDKNLKRSPAANTAKEPSLGADHPFNRDFVGDDPC